MKEEKPKWPPVEGSTFLGIAKHSFNRYDVWINGDVITLKWGRHGTSTFSTKGVRSRAKTEEWARSTLKLLEMHEDPSISPNVRCG